MADVIEVNGVSDVVQEICGKLRKDFADIRVREGESLQKDAEEGPKPHVVYVLLKEDGSLVDKARAFNAAIVDVDQPSNEILKRVRHEVQCQPCSGTGEQIEVVGGHEGLVSCDFCEGTGVAAT